MELKKVGEKLGFKTCGSNSGGNGEWLFDLCWYKGEDELMEEFPLALESEWSHIDQFVRFDFQKLLVARATHRVMVFERIDEAAFTATVDHLIKCIVAFQGTTKGDLYLFACWLCKNAQKFVFRHHIVP